MVAASAYSNCENALGRIRNSRKESENVRGAVYFYPERKTALLSINSPYTNP